MSSDQPKTFEGHLIATGKRFGIVVARFNDFITTQLLRGAVDHLERSGASKTDITVAWVPGSFELPIAARKMAESGDYDAVITLGCVIRGSTVHFDCVVQAATNGVMRAAQETGVPIIFGVLTTDTIEQAVERAGTKLGNNGQKAAAAAVEMVNLFEEIQNSKGK